MFKQLAQLAYHLKSDLTLKMQKWKIAEIINSNDPDEVAHDEPPSSGSTLFILCSLNSQYDKVGQDLLKF